MPIDYGSIDKRGTYLELPPLTMPQNSFNNFLFYSTYTLTCLEDRAWSFALALAMQSLGGMRLVSIQQFAEGIACIILSGIIGKHCDNVSRKKSIIQVVAMNNAPLIFACLCFTVCLSLRETGFNLLYTPLLGLGMVLSAINRLGLNQEKNCLARDWVVVLAKSGTLSRLNAILISLDQLTNVITPLIAGALISLLRLQTTLVILGITGLATMLLKGIALIALLKREPRLLVKEVKGELVVNHDDPSVPGVLATYWHQKIFSAAFGLALLFMTVLSFDGLALGYGQSAGLSDTVLGGFKSFSSLCGILGAISYAFVERQIGVRKTGFFGFTKYYF
ncbi:unnamed protein product, partial [Mesorhabditis spiculigera]